MHGDPATGVVPRRRGPQPGLQAPKPRGRLRGALGRPAQPPAIAVTRFTLIVAVHTTGKNTTPIEACTLQEAQNYLEEFRHLMASRNIFRLLRCKLIQTYHISFP